MSRLIIFVAMISAVALATPRSPDESALLDQVDQRLRTCSPSLTLRPSLDVLPTALRLKVVVVRSADRTVLGSITTRASGASRQAQLRAVTTHVCREANQLR